MREFGSCAVTGDLMSDLLGKSWQYSVQIKVLSEEEEAEQRKNLESKSLDQADTVSENLDTAPEERAITLDEAIAVSAELEIATDNNPVTTVVPDERKLDTAQKNVQLL